MTTRKALQQQGEATRKRLFGKATAAMTEAFPGFGALGDEAIYGGVWSRPGLALPDRMVAALAALCATERTKLIRRHTAAALDLGLDAEAIIEVFVQVGLYAGFPATEDAATEAVAVFAERGIVLEPEPEPAPDERLETLFDRGRDVLSGLHGNRAFEGYASPDNPFTNELYPHAIRYGYGVIWCRHALDKRRRAIVSVAAFTALRAFEQVSKFGQSALNTGLSRQEVVEAIIQTGPISGFPTALNALSSLGRALSAVP